MLDRAHTFFLQAQKVQILATVKQCRKGDAACFCKKKSPGEYADVKSKCRSWYVCVSTKQSYYKTCPSDLVFNEAQGICDWKYAVQCVATNDKPVKPAPKPTPTPKPKPKPAPTPKPKPAKAPPPIRRRRPPPPRRRPPPPRRPPVNSSPSPSILSPPVPGRSPSPSPTIPSPSPNVPETSGYLYVGYYQSWSDPWVSDPAQSFLANLPPYVNVVILSFMRPDCTYPGGMTFSGTGLDFSSDPDVVKRSIALLKQRNPGTKVLIAVGGATYTNFDALNALAIAAFVSEFGLDGVDLDYEPPSANCNIDPDTGVSCDSDGQFVNVTNVIRKAVPRPLMLSAAMWSIGAYGQGEWTNSLPQGQYTGVSVDVLREAGDAFDLLNVMSYDAGVTYQPKDALDAYSSLYSGPITLGVEVANEAWGGHVISLDEVNNLADYVKSKGAAGMMLWSLQKPAAKGPTAQEISQAVCNDFDLPDCDCPLYCTS